MNESVFAMNMRAAYCSFILRLTIIHHGISLSITIGFFSMKHQVVFCVLVLFHSATPRLLSAQWLHADFCCFPLQSHTIIYLYFPHTYSEFQNISFDIISIYFEAVNEQCERKRIRTNTHSNPRARPIINKWKMILMWNNRI